MRRAEVDAELFFAKFKWRILRPLLEATSGASCYL